MAGERQPGRAQQLLAGHDSARGDAPQGDLDDVLAATGAVGLDDVGQLGWMRRSRSGGRPARSTSP